MVRLTLKDVPMTSRRQFLQTATALGGAVAFQMGSLSILSATPKSEMQSKKATLTPNKESNTFDFETEQMQGSIRLDGAYHGVTRLRDKRTGRQVIDPRYSALNLFRLFSINQGMGLPRDMKRTTKVTADAVEVTWPPTDAHKAEITARYEAVVPNAVDLTVTVKSQGTYPGYEIFLSNYFDKVLVPHVFLKPQRRAKSSEPELVVPMVSDAFRGTLLVFPRDAHAARLRLDGRWERNEFSASTIQQSVVRHYGYCLAFQADPDKQLAALLMAHPRHCYAISARYHADSDVDRLTPFSAFDLSLFGDDLLPGDERTVNVRLALTPLDRELSQPLTLYRAFLQ